MFRFGGGGIVSTAWSSCILKWLLFTLAKYWIKLNTYRTMSVPAEAKLIRSPCIQVQIQRKAGKQLTWKDLTTLVQSNTELNPASSPDAASTDVSSTSQPTLTTILAAIGMLDEDMNTRFNTLDSKLKPSPNVPADHTTRISDLEGSATNHESCIAALEKRCTELMEINKSTKSKLIDLENQSRRCNSKIIGLPEEVEKGNLTQFITELPPQLLGVSNFPSGLKTELTTLVHPLHLVIHAP